MDSSQIALLKFDGEPFLPSVLYCTGQFNSKAPKPYILFHPSSNRLNHDAVKKYYKYFKDDLRLTGPQAQREDLAAEATQSENGDADDDVGWSMLKTDVNVADDDSEAIGVSRGTLRYFSPLHASGFFLANVCKEVIRRVRDLFGEDEEIHVYFTAPNYAFEKKEDGPDGQRRSQNYRENISTIVSEHMTGAKWAENVQFRLDGSKDFIYEPYAAYHYYSKVEERTASEESPVSTYLVFDMGGSTTDIAIVQTTREDQDRFTAYPISRSVRRAGEYFDRVILKHLLDYQQVPRRGNAKWSDALSSIEQAKIRVCEGKSAEEHVEIEVDGSVEEHIIDRDLLGTVLKYVWSRGASQRRIGQALRGFLKRARKQMEEHSRFRRPETIDQVFLSGGSTALPGIENLILNDIIASDLTDRDTNDRDEANPFFIRPRQQLQNGTDFPNSVVVAAGRAASLGGSDGGDIEGEFVYAQLHDRDANTYHFERRDDDALKHHPLSNKEDGDEFYLCRVGELPKDEVFKLGEEGFPSFQDLSFDQGSELPSEFELYLRSDVRDFPDTPQVRYSDSYGDVADDEAFIQFQSHIERKEDRVRLKPFVFHAQPRLNYRHRLRRSPSGFVDIPLSRKEEKEGIHICIDFGMSNTAVALYAPRYTFPKDDPTLEVITLGQEEINLHTEIKRLLPKDALPFNKAVRGLNEVEHQFRKDANLSGIARLLQSAYVFAYHAYRRMYEKKQNVSVRSAAATLTSASDAYTSHSLDDVLTDVEILKSILEFGYNDTNLVQKIADFGPGRTLTEIKEMLFEDSPAALTNDRQAPGSNGAKDTDTSASESATQEKKPETSKEAGETITSVTNTERADEEDATDTSASKAGSTDKNGQPDNTEAASESQKIADSSQPENESATEVSASQDSERSSSNQTPSTAKNAPMKSSASPSNRSSNGQPNTSEPDEHWALGMTHWVEGLTQKMLAPLEASNAQTQQTLDELVQGIESVRVHLKDSTETETSSDVKETLHDIRKSLQTLVDRVPDSSNVNESDTSSEEKEDVSSVAEVKRELRDEVEQEGSPFFYFGKKERTLAGFKKFVEEEKGFHYPDRVYRKVWTYCQNDKTRIIILAGAPGAGKSTLARLVAEYYNQDVPKDSNKNREGWEAYWHLESVSPSWLSPDSLFGREDPLRGITVPSQFTRFLIAASEHYQNAYLSSGDGYDRWCVACLDEFNLARPEQYFANVLSQLEADQPRINLGRGNQEIALLLEPNVKLFATINTDAASKVLSPKVLDRSFFIRMTPGLEDLQIVADRLADKHSVAPFHKKMQTVLEDLHTLAQAAQSPIGYRGLHQAYEYASNAGEGATSTETVLKDVLESFFLSKFPGAFAVDDPKQIYQKQLQHEQSSLRTVGGVGDTLDMIARGLPGQASI